MQGVYAVKLNFERLCIVLAVILACIATPVFAGGDDDKVLMQQLADIRQQCVLAHEQNKQKEQEYEAARANPSLSPEKAQQVDREIHILKAEIAKTDQILAQPLPATREERESYLRQASAGIATARQLESTVAKDLGRAPTSRMEKVLSNLGTAERYKPKYGDFDQERNAYNPDLNAPVSRGIGTNFFGIAGQLPPSAVPANRVSSAYERTDVQKATAIAGNDHGTGGGIMLEGTAGGLDTVSSVEYDAAVNALVLNGDLVYFVKIPPWSLATMCRAIGSDRNMLLGVTETMTEGLVFGDKPEIYKTSDMAYDLMLADKFLGDLVFARAKGWTQGYKFPATRPAAANIKTDMLVRFAFGNFQFARNENGQFSVVSSSLEVRMLPVSKVPSQKGQMLPNYNALDNGWTPPEAFITNA